MHEHRRIDMRHYIIPALAFSAITALALPSAADAQTPPAGRQEMGRSMRAGPAMAPAARIIEMREELDLTTEQVEKIRGIQSQLEQQNAPLLEQLAGARQEMQASRQSMTDEERAAMQQRREAMRDSMRSRAPMTDEQREQMRAQMQERRENGARGRQDGQRAMRADVPAELQPVMEQVRANTQRAMEQIQSTLTSEQQQKLRELRPANRPAKQGVRAPGANRGRARAASRGAR
jgi:hypothetical protein